MNKRLISFTVAGLFSVLQAYSQNNGLSVFGDLGVLGNFTKVKDKSGIDMLVGTKAHFGLNFGTSVGNFGVGFMGGYGVYEKPMSSQRRFDFYKKPFADVSELYYHSGGYGSGFIIGRYNSSKILTTSDWFGGYNQGFAFSVPMGGGKFWFTWINDWMNTGYNSSPYFEEERGRVGLDLLVFSPFSSNKGVFFGRRDIFVAGMDISLGSAFEISPTAAYWFKGGAANANDVVQAGVRATLTLGNNTVMSKTTFRSLWQNELKVDNDNGVLLWGDQELLFSGVVSIGGGYLMVGNKRVYSLTDRTRFYGQFATSVALSSVSTVRNYLNAGVKTYYGFFGLRFAPAFNLDVVYAGGNYNEFSVVFNWYVISTSSVEWNIGGGLVGDNVIGLSSNTRNNFIAFTKVAF